MSVCSFCQNEIKNDQPKAELECRHEFHTRCLLIHSLSSYNDYFSCPICKINSITEEIRDIVGDIRRQKMKEIEEDFQNVLQNDIECAEAYKKVLGEFKKIQKHHENFHKKGKVLRKMFKQDIQSLTNLIEGKEKEYEAALKDCSQRKLWLLETQKIRPILNAFEEKYPNFLLKATKLNDNNLPPYHLWDLYFHQPGIWKNYFVG
jgi:gas vesicle protein